MPIGRRSAGVWNKKTQDTLDMDPDWNSMLHRSTSVRVDHWCTVLVIGAEVVGRMAVPRENPGYALRPDLVIFRSAQQMMRGGEGMDGRTRIGMIWHK